MLLPLSRAFSRRPGEELLFLSESAVFKPPKALRGGVPVCWPQFGGVGDLQAHGFARNCEWSVKSQTADQVVLALASSEATKVGETPGSMPATLGFGASD